jgi:outer membrane protein
MKKILLTVFALTMFNVAFAQFNKGRMIVGGAVGFQTTTEKQTGTTPTAKENTFSLSPNFGYFVANKFAVGLNLNLSNTTEKYSGGSYDYKIITRSFIASPFVRYYFGPGIFVQGQYGIGSAKSGYDDPSSSNTTKYAVSQWSLGIGYAYFLNDHVAIEPSVKYQSSVLKEKGQDIKDTNSGIAINIGFQIYLGKRN